MIECWLLTEPYHNSSEIGFETFLPLLGLADHCCKVRAEGLHSCNSIVESVQSVSLEYASAALLLSFAHETHLVIEGFHQIFCSNTGGLAVQSHLAIVDLVRIVPFATCLIQPLFEPCAQRCYVSFLLAPGLVVDSLGSN